MSARILVVEDEPQMGRLLRTSLSARGYEVAVVTDGAAALDIAARWDPHLVLLDLGLPTIDGIEVCRRVRGWSQVPIIVISVRSDEHDKVAALDLGADDYLTKPFGMNELLARVRVALRHGQRDRTPDRPQIQIGDVTLDLVRRLVLVRGQEVHLTPREYELLRVLATNAGKVLTHRMLLAEVWGSGYAQDVPTLRVFITQLRHKIEHDPARPAHILTIPGIGYRFTAAES